MFAEMEFAQNAKPRMFLFEGVLIGSGKRIAALCGKDADQVR